MLFGLQFSCFATLTAFCPGRNLPRQTFGRLQAKLFPAYFAVSVAAIAVQIGTLGLGAAMVPTFIWIALGEC